MPLSTHDRVYRFVRERILAGVPPTVREVQDRFGFRSVASARQHLDRLIAEDRLIKITGISRGLRLPEPQAPTRATPRIPILGQIQAGRPTLAVEDIDGYLSDPVPSGESELFSLRVKGDSMRDAGILEGDFVIVRPQPDAEHGDIVAALIDDEATVKRLIKRGRRIELHPENPDYDPIILNPDDVQLLGKVIEVRRQL